jgi:hypothetical protein
MSEKQTHVHLPLSFGCIGYDKFLSLHDRGLSTVTGIDGPKGYAWAMLISSYVYGVMHGQD